MIGLIPSYGGSSQPGGDTQPPTQPTGLTADSATSTTISVSWTASTDNVGVVLYRIYVDGVEDGTSVGTSYVVSGLTVNTQYDVYVVAEDAVPLQSIPSLTISPSTMDTDAPSVPQNLAASSITSSGMQLDWDVSTDNVSVTGYNVYVDSLLAASPVTNTYQLTGLAASTQYEIRVSAEDAAGNESAQSTAINPTTSAPSGGLGAPSNLVATNTITGSTDISWTPGANAVAHRIYLEVQTHTSGEYGGYGFLYHKTVTGSSVTVDGLGSNLGWNIRVTAIDAAENPTTPPGESSPSNTVSVTTPVASNLFTVEHTVYNGTYDHTYEFQNNIGRGDVDVDPQKQSVYIFHEGTQIIFDGCTFRTKDFGMISYNPGVDLIIRNCTFIGENPNVAGGTQGKIVHMWRPANFIFENNRVFGLRGTWIQEVQSGGEVSVKNNLFFDTKGVVSDGVGGYTTASDPNDENSQCCMVDTATSSNTVSVSYNYNHSRPYNSKTEDAFSMFSVVGSAGNRHEWRGNCVKGRYDNIDPVNGSGNSGTSFQIENDSRYVDIVENVTVNAGNNPFSCSWARNVRWMDNKLVGRPYLPGTTDLIKQQWRGMQLGNEFWRTDIVAVQDTTATGNYIQYPRNSGGTLTFNYNDMLYIRPDAAANGTTESGNTVVQSTPSEADEDAAVAEWWDYIRGKGLVVGPQ